MNPETSNNVIPASAFEIRHKFSKYLIIVKVVLFMVHTIPDNIAARPQTHLWYVVWWDSAVQSQLFSGKM